VSQLPGECWREARALTTRDRQAVVDADGPPAPVSSSGGSATRSFDGATVHAPKATSRARVTSKGCRGRTLTRSRRAVDLALRLFTTEQLRDVSPS